MDWAPLAVLCFDVQEAGAARAGGECGFHGAGQLCVVKGLNYRGAETDL